MGKHLDRIAKQRRPSAWKGIWNMARMAAFFVVFVLAAQELDGWLSVALWVVAAWYVGMQLLIVIGMLMVVVEVVGERRAEAEKPRSAVY